MTSPPIGVAAQVVVSLVSVDLRSVPYCCAVASGMSALRDLRTHTGYQRLSSGDLASDDDFGNRGVSSKLTPNLYDSSLDKHESQTASVFPAILDSRRSATTSSSEDDEVWMKSAESKCRETGLEKSANGRRAFERAGVDEELAAARANLHRERKKREQLEESSARLKGRSVRTASSSSEPGCISDTISSIDLLYAYTHELSLRIRSDLQLQGKEYLIEKMRRAHSDDESEPVEAWFDISTTQNGRDGWHRRYIALSATKLLFFESPEDFLQQKPCRVIQLDLLITVRNIITDTEGHISIAYSNAQCCIHICFVAEGETRLLPWMKKHVPHDELARKHFDYKASLRTSRSLYLRARTFREKQQWLKRFRSRLENCPYSGEADIACGAMLRCYQRIAKFSSDS